MAHVGREGRLGSSEAPGRRTLQLVQCPAWLGSGLSADNEAPGRRDKTGNTTLSLLAGAELGSVLAPLSPIWHLQETGMDVHPGLSPLWGMVELICLLSR